MLSIIFFSPEMFQNQLKKYYFMLLTAEQKLLFCDLHIYLDKVINRSGM
jgi:hypothetical protein